MNAAPKHGKVRSRFHAASIATKDGFWLRRGFVFARAATFLSICSAGFCFALACVSTNQCTEVKRFSAVGAVHLFTLVVPEIAVAIAQLVALGQQGHHRCFRSTEMREPDGLSDADQVDAGIWFHGRQESSRFGHAQEINLSDRLCNINLPRIEKMEKSE